jgi:hypothetical protein
MLASRDLVSEPAQRFFSAKPSSESLQPCPSILFCAIKSSDKREKQLKVSPGSFSFVLSPETWLSVVGERGKLGY